MFRQRRSVGAILAVAVTIAPLHCQKCHLYGRREKGHLCSVNTRRENHETLCDRTRPAGCRWPHREQLKEVATTSNNALAKLAGKVQWVQSFVVDDKSFCIYLADAEAAVREHARLSGIPASKVTEVRNVIDPMTAIS